MRGYNLLLALSCVVLLAQDVLGGCEHCCKGKDNKCKAFGPRLNKANATTCFCDETCSLLGDCCTNYASVCKPVDCVVQEHWDHWSECSESCGWGYKERTRQVLVQPENGGKKCDQIFQKTYCLGEKCVERRSDNRHEIKETGKIIPAEFGAWRNDKLYNPYSDIRKNLFDHYKKEDVIKRPAYCAKYEIVETRGACSNPLASGGGRWTRSLQKGNTICVECQPHAMKRGLGTRCKGHGVYLKDTRWNAVTVSGCHGRWIMSEQQHECSCNPQDSNSFILI